jgi:hypothetical protein
MFSLKQSTGYELTLIDKSGCYTGLNVGPMCAGLQGPLQLKGFPFFPIIALDLVIQGNVELHLRVVYVLFGF